MKYGVLKRNTKMAKSIVSELEKKHNKSMFIAPGIYHLLGNGSIPEILKENGYEVKRVRSRDVINPEGSEDKKDKHQTQEDEPKKQKPPKHKPEPPSKGAGGRAVPNSFLVGIILFYILLN